MVMEGINGSWCRGEESGGRWGCEGANWGRRKESDMWDRVGRKDDGAGPRGTGKREQVKDQEEREDEREERARVVAQENCQGSQ